MKGACRAFLFLSCCFILFSPAKAIDKLNVDRNEKIKVPQQALVQNISNVITVNKYAAANINKATFSKKIPIAIHNAVPSSVRISGKFSNKHKKGIPGILQLLLSKTSNQWNSTLSSIKKRINGIFPISTVASFSVPPLSSKASTLDASQASKVLIFYPTNSSYQTANILNGVFSIEVSTSNPIGMIFVSVGNQFLGYLYLKNNIASLPMSRVKSGIATIDLGDLFSSGLVVEPEHNPLGDEIPLTEDERKALEQFNGLFASIVKNPDINGNGIIDCMEGEKFFLSIAYDFNSGNFGGNLTPSMSSFGIRLYQIHFFSTTTNCPDKVTVFGPNGSPFSPSRTLDRVVIGTYCTHRYVNFDNPVPLIEGEYTIEYPDELLTFHIPDQSPILSSVIIMLPTVILNDDGTIKAIKWVYRLANGSDESVNPASLMKNILINMSTGTDLSDQLPTIIVPNTETTEVDVPYTVMWDNIYQIATSYDDVYGNIYGLMWMK